MHCGLNCSTMLGVTSWYDLDRLDLTGYATIDLPAQKRVSDILAQAQRSDISSRRITSVGHRLLHTTRAICT